jgi:hypothetical protein
MTGTRSGDALLQAAYQSWMQADRGGHLDDGAWQRLAAGDAAQSERDLLFAHVMTCTQCSEVWRSLSFLQIEAEREGLIEPRAATSASWFRSMLMPIAIAATLVIGIASVVLLRPPAPVDDVSRGTTTMAAVEGLMMAYAADATPMLLWTPVPAATTYHVEIFTEDGRPLWSGDVDTPPMRWPSGTPREKGAYRWRVEARNANGAVARSTLMPLELTR